VETTRGRRTTAAALAAFLAAAFLPLIARAGAPRKTRSLKLDMALFKAVDAGNAAKVVSLLNKGVDPNDHDPEDGSTALIRAAKDNHLQIARILLDHGADINERGLGMPGATAIMLAASHGNADMVRLLIAHGADIKARDAYAHYTVLMWAAGSGTPETAGILLDHGANLKARDIPHGSTPLMIAAANGKAEIVRLFLARGADPAARDFDGQTAFSMACTDWDGQEPCPKDEMAGLLAPARFNALEHPQPSVNAYVGAYGEVLTFENGETVSTRMHGPIEDIRIYPKWDSRAPKGRAPVLFQPTKADYKPENFAALGLKQILVIPKSMPGGFDQLDSLLDAKLKSLTDSDGTEYPPKGLIVWPDGSREFIIQGGGWEYWQIYSESPRNFYIATTGRDPANYDDPDLASLAKFLMNAGPAPLPLKEWRQVLSGNVPSWPLNPEDPNLWIVLIYLGLNALFLWLAFGGRKLKTRIVGRCLFGFSNAFALLTAAAIAFEVFTMSGLFRNQFMVNFYLMILSAAACVLLTRHWRAKNPKTTLIVSLAVIAYLAWLSYYPPQPRELLVDWLDEVPFTIFFLFSEGIALALLFSLLMKPGEDLDHENS